MTEAIHRITGSWRFDLGIEPSGLKESRITIIVLGILTALLGVLILSQVPYLNSLGTTAGWTSIGVGTGVALLCSLIKCVKGKKAPGKKPSNQDQQGILKKLQQEPKTPKLPPNPN